ncbi:MAG: hypothetical protein ACTHMS_06935 [Jatrophihabitans sp.]|uniref:hypothetical protein n=1 Tax=Jatrophihabitans sp. TaxID=1932789 RepID=UPI003F7DAA81
MSGSKDWAKLRQVVIATTDHEGDVAATRKAFGLGPGFADPEVHEMHLVDATMPVSDTTYLEFVAPIDERAGVHRWLQKIGGRGGYCLSVQHSNPGAAKARAEARGVRAVADVVVFGHNVVQLHPKDMGLLLELDGIDDPDVWFWDDVDPGPESGATVDRIVSVDVPVADPAAMTALWHDVLGFDASAGATEVDLGETTVHFVPGGPSAQWTVRLRRAEQAGDVTVPELAGVRFELV